MDEISVMISVVDCVRKECGDAATRMLAMRHRHKGLTHPQVFQLIKNPNPLVQFWLGQIATLQSYQGL
jgi:hypothetical protein